MQNGYNTECDNFSFYFPFQGKCIHLVDIFIIFYLKRVRKHFGTSRLISGQRIPLKWGSTLKAKTSQILSPSRQKHCTELLSLQIQSPLIFCSSGHSTDLSQRSHSNKVISIQTALKTDFLTKPGLFQGCYTYEKAMLSTRSIQCLK